ncbi:MAG: hypothetical protein EB162_03225 [Euryarchaeota archaeon]|nr:hypothetical protein [Euryarchaeota archaeon]
MSAKSIKLNRDLDRMLSQAIERDLLVRIGWGREGDEKPKNGEIGALSMLPENSRSLLLGNLGEGAGLMNRGGTATIQGSVSSIAGAWMSSGRLVVEKDAGDRVGFFMSGGSMVIHGGMSGGVIVVCGGHQEKSDSEMKHGRYSDIPVDVIDLASSLGIEIPLEASVFLGTKDPHEDLLPMLERGDCFTGIGIMASGIARGSSHDVVDTSTKIQSCSEEGLEILLKRPWIEFQESGGKEGTHIVKSLPGASDILIIGGQNIGELEKESLNSSGFILDIDSLPSMNDAELEAIVVSIRSRMAPGSLVMLSDRVDRVDELARKTRDLGLDGILVDVKSLDSSGPTVALPRIGMANKRHRISEEGRLVMIRLDGDTSPETLIIAKCAGIDVVVSPGILGRPSDFDAKLRGIMKEMGIQSINSANRSNIRALDHNVAMQTGLRLTGLERPLPAWTRGD